jgi:hypothetical protein
MKHSQDEYTVVERLEEDQVISVCANAYRIAQVWTRDVVMRPVGNFLAVLPYLVNERNGAQGIVERDVVADLFQVNLGLRREVRARLLRAVFGDLCVLALQTVKNFGGGFWFAAAATLFDFATQTVYYRLATLLLFFQKSQPIADDFAGGSITPTVQLLLYEFLEVVADCVA